MPSAAQAMPNMWAREKPIKMQMAMMMQGMMAAEGKGGEFGSIQVPDSLLICGTYQASHGCALLCEWQQHMRAHAAHTSGTVARAWLAPLVAQGQAKASTGTACAAGRLTRLVAQGQAEDDVGGSAGAAGISNVLRGGLVVWCVFLRVGHVNHVYGTAAGSSSSLVAFLS